MDHYRCRPPAGRYFGGNAEEASRTLVDPCWPRDWTIIAINYRGYGTSEGAPGEAALVADALVVFDTLAALPDVDARRIVAFGRSLGTGVAVQLAAAASAPAWRCSWRPRGPSPG